MDEIKILIRKLILVLLLKCLLQHLFIISESNLQCDVQK